MEQRRRTHPKTASLLPHPLSQSVVHPQPRLPHARAVASRIGQAERQRRLSHVPQQLGEELLVLGTGDPQSGLGHEVTERQRLRESIAAPGHERRDLAQHHLQCGVVLEQVMHLHQPEPPLTARLCRHVYAQQRCPSQVHPASGEREQLGLRVITVAGQGDLGDRDNRTFPDHLHRFGQRLPHEPGAVDVVPVHDPLQRIQERVQPLTTVKAEHHRHEVYVRIPRAGEQVVEEHAFLQRRQRIHVGNVRRAALDRLADQVDLRRRQFHQWQHLRRNHLHILLGNPVRGHLHHTPATAGSSQRRRRRRLEQHPHRHPEPLLTQPLHQRHRQQRMPTQLEEVVLHPYAIDAQYIREHLTHQLFSHRGRTPPTGRRILRRGEGCPVQLPVDRQRQPVEHHDGRGHHVLRQPRAPEGTHFAGQFVAPSTITVRDDVRDEALITLGAPTGDHHRASHPGMCRQDGLDLTRLDPEAADLHLVVRTADKHQLPVRGPPRQVAGPVHPFTRITERAGHEPLRRQPRSLVVSACQTRAGHIQLPRHPGRDRLKEPVQDIDTGVVDRSADRNSPTCRLTPTAVP